MTIPVKKTKDRIIKFATNRQVVLNEYDEDAFWIREGSTIVHVIIDPFDEQKDAIITFLSFVVKGARLDEELKTKLLKLNVTLTFGSFGIEDDTITFRYCILGGEHVDEEEFFNALAMVAIIADEYDNKIINTHGGMTALDVLENNYRTQEKREVLPW